MFWERFQELLKEKNISQKDIAILCNLTTGAVSLWKKGITPQKKTLKILTNYFNVSADYLLGYTDIKLTNEQKEITENEKQIILKYNNATESIKTAVNKLLDVN